MNDKMIIDICCGSRMFWFDKNNDNTIFMDERKIETKLCDNRKLIVNPDIIGDFRNIPFEDKKFKLVIFDPPHLINLGQNSWLALKYGKLLPTWEDDIRKGFEECFRILDDYGVLIFKWNEEQIKLKDILKLTDNTPLFGNKRSKTHWIVFMNIPKDVDQNG